MTKTDVVLDAETGVYRYLDLLPGGSKMLVRTRGATKGRTNEVATLEKEPGPWGDWKVMSRPATADAALLPETWPGQHPGIISTRTLADTFMGNADLWASVRE